MNVPERGQLPDLATLVSTMVNLEAKSRQSGYKLNATDFQTLLGLLKQLVFYLALHDSAVLLHECLLWYTAGTLPEGYTAKYTDVQIQAFEAAYSTLKQ